MSKLLREYISLDYDKEKIIEAKDKGGPIVIPALLQRADTKNQNGRIYPRSILQREVENYTKAVKERRALGECDHPDNSVVELKNASHLISDIWWEGDDVKGKVEILNTPTGNILKSLMESGVKLGISSRGVGETKKTNEGADIVQEDFTLICFDMVSEPSTDGAWLGESKIVGLDYVRQHISKNDRIYRICNEILLKR